METLTSCISSSYESHRDQVKRSLLSAIVDKDEQ